jgi:Ca-activated chloride channel family protein
MTRFANPPLLALLALVGLFLYVEFRLVRRRRPAVRYPALAAVRRAAGSDSSWKRFLGPIVRAAALSLLVVAFARPQAGSGSESVLTEGIDIVVAMDVSGSMRAEDFKPKNRLAVAKEVFADFVRGRTSDRIGLVVFAAQSFTQCPLTLDYSVLLQLAESVEVGMIDESSTAIGMGIATAANRLRESDARSKVIVLLTDGRNNAGEIDPITAAEAAQALGIRIYTIGAGTPEGGPIPIDDPVWGRRYVQVATDIDEDTLNEIARVTGGKYYRAKTPGMLAEVFREIGELEKTKIEVKHFTSYTELAPRFMIAGLLLLIAGLLIAAFVTRGLP